MGDEKNGEFVVKRRGRPKGAKSHRKTMETEECKRTDAIRSENHMSDEGAEKNEEIVAKKRGRPKGVKNHRKATETEECKGTDTNRIEVPEMAMTNIANNDKEMSSSTKISHKSFDDKLPNDIDAEYLDKVLSKRYNSENCKLAENIISAFFDSLEDMNNFTDIDIDFADLNKTYEMLNGHLSEVSELQTMANSKSITSISLAKYFVKKFSYLPESSVHYIKGSDLLKHRENNSKHNIDALDSNIGRPRKRIVTSFEYNQENKYNRRLANKGK